MPLDTFIWIPSYTTQAKWQPKLLTLDFGDAYDQQLPDGLNNVKLQFNVVFDKIGTAEANAIMAFIMAHQGYIPFYFTPPPLMMNSQGQLIPNRYDDGTGTMRWKCAMSDDTFDQANSDSLQLPFVQTFNFS